MQQDKIKNLLEKMVHVGFCGTTTHLVLLIPRSMAIPNLICNNYSGRIDETHNHSLNDESLRTWMAEVDLIVNLRLLIVENISDPKSEIPPSPSKLQSNAQHIPGEFWSRWRKEFLQSLQVKEIWKKRMQNLANGVIFCERWFSSESVVTGGNSWYWC